MKAVVVDEFGDISQDRYTETASPQPQKGEVLLRLHSSEVNYPDILYLNGRYQNLPQRPFVPGLAGAGVVIALGEGVPQTALGKRVLALPSHGSFAQELALPWAHCFEMPDEMDFETAAAFGLVYQTAWFALRERAQMKTGDRVLVLGATGGIGRAAIALARAYGAKQVLAVSRGATDDLGADVVIDAGVEDLREALRHQVLAATEGHGADVVIDPVGGAISAAALRAMAWSGRIVTLGFASGEIPKIAANYLLVKNITASGLQWTDYRARQPERVAQAQAEMFALWREGRLSPNVVLSTSLRDYRQALERLSAGNLAGKAVLNISGE